MTDTFDDDEPIECYCCPCCDCLCEDDDADFADCS